MESSAPFKQVLNQTVKRVGLRKRANFRLTRSSLNRALSIRRTSRPGIATRSLMSAMALRMAGSARLWPTSRTPEVRLERQPADLGRDRGVAVGRQVRDADVMSCDPQHWKTGPLRRSSSAKVAGPSVTLSPERTAPQGAAGRRAPDVLGCGGPGERPGSGLGSGHRGAQKHTHARWRAGGGPGAEARGSPRRSPPGGRLCP
jgi:hypothetical protein